MRRTVRTTVAATAALVTLGLVAPGASAGVTEIDQSARDPELALGATGKAATMYRFAGSDRTRTAAAAAMTVTYAESRTPLGQVAILADSGTFPDALAAAPLAETLSAPILLSNSNGTLSNLTLQQLDRHDTVIIASGRSVIPEATADLLREHEIEVIRYAGASRFDTAAVLGLASLYWASVAEGNGSTPGDVPEEITTYLADGESFPDALTAGPAAARDGDSRILLTSGSTLTPMTEAALLGNPAGIRGVDEAALKPLVEWWGTAQPKGIIRTVGGAATEAAETSDLSVATKLVGADRYATAAAVADYGLPRGLFPNGFVIASGQSFADGVIGGGFGGNIGAPLLLTQQDKLPAATIAAIENRAVNNDIVSIFGGDASVSKAVSRELAAMFSW